MSVPKVLRTAAPVEGHGYAATYADFIDDGGLEGTWVPTRRDLRDGRRSALYMQKWCGDCQDHNRYRARLSRLHAAYGRRTR